MRYENLENYSTEDLEDLHDGLCMSRCRGMFPYETHKQYYDDMDADIAKISEILNNRRKKQEN